MQDTTKSKAPWTPEQVQQLKTWQECGYVHPFTCCSHNDCDRHSREDHGVLIPATEGWVCPCGEWKQDWCHSFMLDPDWLRMASGAAEALTALKRSLDRSGHD